MSPHKPEAPGERRRDPQRDDRGREALDEPPEDEPRSGLADADATIEDPGTRGANFGKGGKGIVERDDPDKIE